MAKNRKREERILFGSHRTVKELCSSVVVLTGLFYDPFVQTSIKGTENHYQLTRLANSEILSAQPTVNV